jgi:hypothetical protein
MRTCSYVLASLGLFFMLFLASSVAHAEPDAAGSQRVAIAHLDFEGKIPEGLQELFAQRLVQGLSAARFEVLPGTDVHQKLLAANPALAACQSVSCYPAMAAALDASYLIAAHVSENSKTYTMVMEIINGRTGGVLASNRERCETCGAEDAGEKMGLAASALRERLEVVSRAPARFILRSRPAGASVTLDAKAAGSTPLDTELPSGPHHVQLQLAGHDDLSRTFTVVSGVDEAMDFDLVAIPSKVPYRAVGWTSLAGGVLLLAAGIATMSFDNHEIACSGSEQDLNGRCPWVRSTKWWAATMVGLGAAAATVGSTFLYLAPRPGTTSLGATAGVTGSF